jgi:hypothetical protein
VISAASDLHQSGTSPGAGTFSCVACNSQVSLRALDKLPACPRCGEESYRRASMFEPVTEESGDVTQVGTDGAVERIPSGNTLEFQIPSPPDSPPGWLEEARREAEAPGTYLAWEDAGIELYELEHGWTRIGRSAGADLRLDDPTVSRRHALIAWEEGGWPRVLDDRSLNGIVLNGEPVDWGALEDGDELVVGRYRLHLLEA